MLIDLMCDDEPYFCDLSIFLEEEINSRLSYLILDKYSKSK